MNYKDKIFERKSQLYSERDRERKRQREGEGSQDRHRVCVCKGGLLVLSKSV
jgi:hypothetical protein